MGKTLRDKGRAILASKRKRVKREEIGGVLPGRGMWIIHPERKRLIGRIIMVRRSGEIVARGNLGQKMELNQQTIKASGYIYSPDEPSGVWQTFPYMEPARKLTKEDLELYNIVEVDENGQPKKVKAPKVVKYSPCLCGCGTDCKSRFVVGHDAKFKSALRKAKRKLKLTQEQYDYLAAAKWMTDDLWKNVSKQRAK